ncbi:MAG: DUF4918 family protein [Flavobacteriales bacterium]|nr:DUF4918 family protein [Flavobacteriales bacterium]
MLADRLLQHVLSFSLAGTRLPKGVHVLDPFNGPHADEVRRIVTTFHTKYYSDDRPRTLMLGINPGRLGAGSTGLSFTDTKRCESDLGIPVNGLRTHEPSSDFFYRMVRAAGGPDTFYGQVYVHAICPLGFVKKTSAGSPEEPGDPAGERDVAKGPLQENLRRSGPNGSAINLNYYDDKALEQAVTPFVEQWLRTLVNCGMRTDRVLIIGTGKNAAYFGKLNERLGLFNKVVALEHPRYVMQYKARSLEVYIDKYLAALAEIGK